MKTLSQGTCSVDWEGTSVGRVCLPSVQEAEFQLQD